jgi:hypothetical protein
MTRSFEIEIAQNTDIPELLDFVFNARQNMFPKLHGTGCILITNFPVWR